MYLPNVPLSSLNVVLFLSSTQSNPLVPLRIHNSITRYLKLLHNFALLFTAASVSFETIVRLSRLRTPTDVNSSCDINFIQLNISSAGPVHNFETEHFNNVLPCVSVKNQRTT